MGVGVGARGKLVEPIPQRRHRVIDHLAGSIQQAQRVCLDDIWQTKRIAQGLLITAWAHFKSSFCLYERIP